MERKNIFIIITIILVVTAIVFYIIFSRSMSSPNSNVSSSQNENANSAIPSLSGGDAKNNISQGIVPSDDISKQLKNNAEVAQNTESRTSEFTAKNSSGENMPFRSFLQSSGLKIDESVLRLSDQVEYKISNCLTDSSVPSVGLIFEVNKDQDLKSYVASVDHLTEAVKNWENKIFQGLAPLFFPGESFSQVPSFSEVRFDTSNNINSVIIRFANLKSVSGKTFSVDWSMFNNQIFISNNKDCLRKMLNEYQDQLEP